MSVIIKGAKMPEECLKCLMCDKNFSNLEGETINDWMCLLKMRFVPEDGRAEWCPLAEVPTLHGRLVDADKIIKDIKKSRAFHGDALLILQDIFDEAPTVIEAEEDSHA